MVVVPLLQLLEAIVTIPHPVQIRADRQASSELTFQMLCLGVRPPRTKGSPCTVSGQWSLEVDPHCLNCLATLRGVAQAPLIS